MRNINDTKNYEYVSVRVKTRIIRIGILKFVGMISVSPVNLTPISAIGEQRIDVYEDISRVPLPSA